MVSPFRIRHSAYVVQQGSLIAYPTESVYGLGCDPLNPYAVIDLLQLKSRPIEKGLIIIGSALKQLETFIDPLNSDQRNKIINTNKVTTWLAPAHNAPYWLTGKHQTLAIRLTTHPVAKQLCDILGHPLVSTSANPAGKTPATTALKTRLYFDEMIEHIIHGNTGPLNKPTEIRDLVTDTIVRAG